MPARRRAGFEGGQAWIDIRRAAYLSVRGPDGLHRNPLFEQARQDFAAFAGAPAEGRKADGPSGLMARPVRSEPPEGGDSVRTQG